MLDERGIRALPDEERNTLWVSSSTNDMDIYATTRNIAPDGNDVWEVGRQQEPVPVAKGWLRASHRKLDAELSLPFRPCHEHDETQWLNRNQPVGLDVRISLTCRVFRKRHRLHLDIQPRNELGSAPCAH